MLEMKCVHVETEMRFIPLKKLKLGFQCGFYGAPQETTGKIGISQKVPCGTPYSLSHLGGLIFGRLDGNSLLFENNVNLL